MKISLETVARIYAAGRNYANLAAGAAFSLGLVSASQNKTVTESLAEIANGVSMIVHGFTSIWQVAVVVGAPVVGGVLAWYAQRSAKTDNKIEAAKAVASDPSDPKQLDAQIALSNAAATIPGATKVVNPVIADNPATAPNVVKT